MRAGPYELIRRLGAGGMGEVWMGRREAMGGAAKTVAIKMLKPNSSRKEAEVAADLEMFMAEARLSMLLNNSNIVQVFDVGVTDEGTPYMAMEWVDGMNLSELADQLRDRGERLPVALCAHVVGEVLKGLAYAHEFKQEGVLRPVIHRDVSPHNVMISVAGEVKLMDFGIARLATDETSGQHVRGKLRYMPPEQLTASAREPTIDLFAVGAVLHELLDGQKFRAEVVDEGRLYGMVLQGEVGPLSHPDEVPPEIDEVRLGLLAKLEYRIPSARAAYRKLSSWSKYRDAKFEIEELIERLSKPAVRMPAPVRPPIHAAPVELPKTQQLPRTEMLPSPSPRKPLLDADNEPDLWNSRVRPMLDLSDIDYERSSSRPDEQTWIEERSSVEEAEEEPASEHVAWSGSNSLAWLESVSKKILTEAAPVDEAWTDTDKREKSGIDEVTHERPRLSGASEQTDEQPRAVAIAGSFVTASAGASEAAAAVTTSEARPALATQTGSRSVVVPSSRWRTRVLSAGLLLLGLSFGTFGAGEMLGWWSPDEVEVPEVASGPGEAEVPAPEPASAPQLVAESVPSPEPKVEPPPVSVEALPPKPEVVEGPPTDAVAGLGGLGQVSKPETPKPTLGKPTPKSTPKPPVTAKIPVTIKPTQGGPKYLYVQIDGGKEHIIDKLGGSKSIATKLSRGPHNISSRLRATDPWRPKKITVPDGEQVTIEIAMDGTVTVK